jgi:SAM-dependent methyltransferase
VTLAIWHDVECGGYSADLALWHQLADRERGPVLDVGAGTGRVALTLAAVGHTVWALDREPELLAALSSRAAERGLTVETVVADARDFAVAQSFGLIIVPMQTIQLLPERAGFLAAARRHVRPGGLLAVAITGGLEPFDADNAFLPHPDVHELHERIRRTIPPNGGAVEERDDVIELAQVDVAGLEAEGRSAGFAPEPARHIAPTLEHVGSEVVLLRG